jgi:cell division protein FtsI (penicillin-binding protein 3)
MTPTALRLRLASIAGVFFMLLLVALGRAVQLTVIESPALRTMANRQHGTRVTLPPERGPIVDRHGQILAMTTESAAIFLRPRQFGDDAEALKRLARVLEMPTGLVADKAAASAPFVWLARDASPEQAAAIAELGLPGVGSEPARRRLYPRGALASQVIGFAGIDGQGLEGIELAYDHLLGGPTESRVVQRDARGRRMFLGEEVWTGARRMPPRVELTIDTNLQQVAEAELEAAVHARRAEGGVAVVMDPLTGEILALASSPRFDPNALSTATAAQWRNRVIADSFEPGSTFKGILAAAAIEAGVVRPQERLHCGGGSYAVGKRVVHDHDPYGVLTFADIIRHSSNIGSAKIGERLGRARFHAAIRAFGFGAPTGVDLPGEVAGLVTPVESWARINLVTISFGQGIAVTPLQLLRAYAAIANEGKLMRPYLVRRVVAADGTVLHENVPQVMGQPISPETAAIVTQLLQGVVDGGTGKQARVEGLPVAGKTGTAQKVDGKTGRYSAHARMSSFIGFVPANDPRFVILVVIDTPRTAVYGGVVAAPVFQRIAEFGVDRMGLRIATMPAGDGGKVERAEQPPAAQLVSWGTAGGPRGMPSFLGLSMREALVRAARAGWEVDASGSGYVIAQDPPPGAEAGTGKRLELRFGSGAS